MPIQWQCPGQPKCMKTYTYVQGFKGHIASCKHAQKKKVQKRREEIETMLDIIEFVENEQKGNITLARTDIQLYKRTPDIQLDYN